MLSLHGHARELSFACHVILLIDGICQQNVLAIAGVEQVIMTNIPFDDKEASQWIAGKQVSREDEEDKKQLWELTLGISHTGASKLQGGSSCGSAAVRRLGHCSASPSERCVHGLTWLGLPVKNIVT
jgi:hypothetical protein